MNAEILIKYTPALAAAISRRSLQHLITKRTKIIMVASWLMCGMLWTIGGGQWFVILLTGFLSALTFFAIAVFVIVQRRAVSTLRRFDPPEETLSFDDEGISVKSALGESSIRWEAIKELCRFRDVWLLCASKESFVSLPVEQVPQDLRDEIVAIIQANGGKVD